MPGALLGRKAAHSGGCRRIDAHAKGKATVDTETCVWVDRKAEKAVLCDCRIELPPDRYPVTSSVCADVSWSWRCRLRQSGQAAQSCLKHCRARRLGICMCKVALVEVYQKDLWLTDKQVVRFTLAHGLYCHERTHPQKMWQRLGCSHRRCTRDCESSCHHWLCV